MWSYSAIVASAPWLLLAAGSIPSGWANRNFLAMRKLSKAVTTIALLLLGSAAVLLVGYGPAPSGGASAWGVNVYWDTLSATMALLIGVVGWIIVRFACQNLDGEISQGRFLRWTLFSLGSVLLLVVSGNLLLFMVGWTLTSFGLHQLLRQYPDRAWAVWTARKKFVISRLGDLFLLAAIWLTYRQFESFDFAEIFAAAESYRPAGEAAWNLTFISTLYVLGAMTKSAQFPFHTWLPDTLETPTAVSALMHAGIINAGGFLVIRLSPIVALSPIALSFLAIIGGFTAVLGGVMMLTQASVKRQLAYSTIAQMGFMMLQCGLGAFSTALLHIVAHSIYKAYAFLRSGSVLEEAKKLQADTVFKEKAAPRFTTMLVAILLSMAICTATVWLLKIDVLAKNGVVVLGIVLVLAIASLLNHAFVSGSLRLAMQSVLVGTFVAVFYFAAYLAIDTWLGDSVAHPSQPMTLLPIVCTILVSIGFTCLFLLEAFLPITERSRALQIFYVHALNGFYLDIPARRLTGFLWGRLNPVP